MLELVPGRAAVVVCMATPTNLDRLPDLGSIVRLRVAPDELLLLGEPGSGPALAERAEAFLRGRGDVGLVAEQSGGWSLWSVRGPRSEEVLRRLSVLPIPSGRPAFLQGAVAQVPAKILLSGEVVHILVPAPVGHHLRDRLLAACADLSPSVASPEALLARAPRLA